MRRAIEELQAGGVEADIWKIEGVEERSDGEMLVAQARTGGRDEVSCVVLGRGADDAKVDHWLTQAAPVEGFIGFAIGRSIWWDPLKAYVDGKIERAAGARRIAENYLRFISVYERARPPLAGQASWRCGCARASPSGSGLSSKRSRWTATGATRCGARPNGAKPSGRRQAPETGVAALPRAGVHADPHRRHRDGDHVPHAVPAAGLTASALCGRGGAR